MNWDKVSIRQWRRKLKLTQTEMAQWLGCRQQTISEWEQGLYQPANAYSRLLDWMTTHEQEVIMKIAEKRRQDLKPRSETIFSLSKNAVQHLDQFFSNSSMTSFSENTPPSTMSEAPPFDPAVD